MNLMVSDYQSATILFRMHLFFRGVACKDLFKNDGFFICIDEQEPPKSPVCLHVHHFGRSRDWKMKLDGTAGLGGSWVLKCVRFIRRFNMYVCESQHFDSRGYRVPVWTEGHSIAVVIWTEICHQMIGSMSAPDPPFQEWCQGSDFLWFLIKDTFDSNNLWPMSNSSYIISIQDHHFLELKITIICQAFSGLWFCNLFILLFYPLLVG